MNGMNGGNPAMAGAPLHAGTQQDLQIIWGLVEELSRQLADDRRLVQDVVGASGRIRNRARAHSLGNEDLIAAAEEELQTQEADVENRISILTECLEKSNYSRDQNAALLNAYVLMVQNTLKQFHEYKARHVADVAAWHRSYRAQLAEARAENSRLREQIWEMQARAGAANTFLRRFRARIDGEADELRGDGEETGSWPVRAEEEEGRQGIAATEAFECASTPAKRTTRVGGAGRRERRIETKAVRQELRFWKRLAMPELPDDDPYWSDNDDLFDPVVKLDMERKAAAKKLVREQLAAAALATDENLLSHLDDDDLEDETSFADAGAGASQQRRAQTMQQVVPLGMMGGVPMKRDGSGSPGMPILPPRPPIAGHMASIRQ